MLTNLCIWSDFKSTISFAYINITYSNLAKFLKIYIQSINIIIMVIVLTIFSIYHQIINVYHLRQNIYWKWKGNYYRIERKKMWGNFNFRNRLSCIEKRKKWSHIQTNRWIKQSCCQTLKWSVKPKCYILTSIREQ